MLIWCCWACRIDAELTEAQTGIETVNRERKLSQQEAKRELSGYETQYKATLEKNAEIEAASAEIERELREIMSQLPKYALALCFPWHRFFAGAWSGIWLQCWL